MRTIELIFTFLIGSLGVIFFIIAIRNPKTVFVDLPLFVLKAPWLIFKESFVGQLLFFGGDYDETYKTARKRYFNFDRATKIWLVWETDREWIEKKIAEGLVSINEKPDAHIFLITTGKNLSTIKASDSIPFYTFHYIIQWLSEAKVESVGLVVTPRMRYSFYNDPDSENIIGCTEKGNGFYISLMEDYGNRPFLRLSKDIAMRNEWSPQSLERQIAEEVRSQ